MKDVIYVFCAVIGFVLTTIGVAQIGEGGRAKARSSGFPPSVEAMFSHESPHSFASGSSSAGMVPVETVAYAVFGWVLQIVGCAVYAQSRGRSAAFGLLGLLSPIGYVFLALLNPATPPPTPEPQG